MTSPGGQDTKVHDGYTTLCDLVRSLVGLPGSTPDVTDLEESKLPLNPDEGRL